MPNHLTQWVTQQPLELLSEQTGEVVCAILSQTGSLLTLHRNRFLPRQLDVREDDVFVCTVPLPSMNTQVLDFIATHDTLAILIANPFRIILIQTRVVGGIPYPMGMFPLPRQITEDSQLTLGNYGSNLLLVYTTVAAPANSQVQPIPGIEEHTYPQAVHYMVLSGENFHSVYGGTVKHKVGEEWVPFTLQWPERIRLIKQATGVNTAALMVMSWRGCPIYKFLGKDKIEQYTTFDPNHALGYTIGEFGSNRIVPTLFSASSWKLAIQANARLLTSDYALQPEYDAFADFDLAWLSVSVNGVLVSSPLTAAIYVNSGDIVHLTVTPTRHIANFMLWSTPAIGWRVVEPVLKAYRSVVVQPWIEKNSACIFSGMIRTIGARRRLTLQIKAEVW